MTVGRAVLGTSLRGSTPFDSPTYMRFALVFQPYGLRVVPEPSALAVQGPFSVSMARELEQPGPPLSHTMRGSVDGFERLSESHAK